VTGSEDGSRPFSAFMADALYADATGFFEHEQPGRARGAFVTSPEIGPLFGRLVAVFLDAAWRARGEVSPFVFVDAGAGHGQLAFTGLRSAPACLTAGAFHYLAVERSASGRAAMTERFDTMPVVAVRDALPRDGSVHVVFANELIDNLPFDVYERGADGWREVRVAAAGDGRVAREVLAPAGAVATAELAELAPDAPAGTRLPRLVAADAWLGEVVDALAPGGEVVVVDYAATTAAMVARSPGWLRTYRDHAAGGDALASPGSQDITADVWREAFVALAARCGLVVREVTTQAAWLRELGIDDLVAEGRAAWQARGVMDLAALEARSRVAEAAALIDPDGLGGFMVMRLEKASEPAL
jgi:SAM-dependent MidA family methyltransferase